MSLRNGLIFGFSTLALLALAVFLGNMVWYHISNIALRLAVTTFLLLALATVIQILYLLLIHRYKVGI